MRKTELTNPALCKVVVEMAEGLIDADLGGDVLKKRVALPGREKSDGVRTLLATRKGTRWFCVFGFEKRDRAHISGVELEGLQSPASDLLASTNQRLDEAVSKGPLLKICRFHEN